MDLNHRSRFNFDEELRLESKRVLADSIFQRAPIQSRLLRYLCERAIKGGSPPSQYEVAVDGLGKDPDYDIEGDSYPRVQISRLRRSLDAYYSRTQPGNCMRLAIEAGSYRLVLEHFDPANPKGSPDDANRDDDNIADKSSGSRNWSAPGRKWLFPALAMVLVVLVLVLAVRWIGGGGTSAGPAKPSTLLVIDTGMLATQELAAEPLINAIERVAEIQLANSFVSKPLATGRSAGEADYVLTLNFDVAGAGIDGVFLGFADDDGDVLYTREIAYDPQDPRGFVSELEASLVYITSPIGTIAANELPEASDPLSSDYACFLQIENQRNRAVATENLVNQCLEAFPNSDYRAFWYARRAFSTYQAEIVAGREVTRSHPGWSDVRLALEVDRFNAFANFIAAKVELAEGNCEAARGFIGRALERGGSYPVLVAGLEANAASCAGTPKEQAQLAERIGTMARYNPSPDPLLHVYLIIGLLGAGDRDAAREVAMRTIIDQPQGPFEQTSDLLRRSLEDRRTARMNREKISDAIYLFVWNETATEQIVSTITD